MAPSNARVLFVCTANVCRSPLAQLTFFAELAAKVDVAGVTVVSAGVHPIGDVPMCRLAAMTRTDDEWARRAAKHRATQLSELEASRADLVLAVSRSSRSAVAHAAPAVRSRTFTLPEALALGAGFTPLPGADIADTIRRFAVYLDEQRGVQRIPQRRKLPWRRWVDPVSIDDGHVGTEREHAATVRRTAAIATSLAALLTAVPR